MTSRRPWWWSRTKAFVSSWNLTLFSCKFFVKNSFFDIQHCRLVTWLQTRTGDQGCRSGESRDRRHMWVELVVGSLLCSGFPLSSKTNISKFQFHQESGRYHGKFLGAREGGTWVHFCWVCAAGLFEPLSHYILF